ncbi:hypothetical protein [Yoonia vestfoldensis]|uniref:Hint domain protein n=1 Tax=Yoonia vestfoldensis TaxID=245188 RepID=A0A1Y0EI77_9RHOB|nr:hypothetical protein [Yoonia vestfoldensis]ARU03121.1 hypothetical protein LOKVESSMR4R_03856 [Yoonia vestfoldensis]
MSIKNHLTATVSSACLVLYTSAPLSGQSIADLITGRAEQSVDRVMRNQNINAAHQAMMAMQSAHTLMKRLIQISDLRDEWNNNDGGFLAIEKWVKDNEGRLDRNIYPYEYRHVDGAVPFQERLHGRSNYNIKYRVCGVGDINPTTGLPDRGYRYALLTILPKLPVGYDSILEVTGTAGLHELNLREVSLMPDDRRGRGTIGVLNASDEMTTLDGSTAIPLPDCITDSGDWYAESRTFDPETLAIFEWVTPRELNFIHKMQAGAVTDTALCREPFVASEYGVPADQIIGQAQFARGRLHVSLWGDDNPTTDRGRAINPDNGTPSDTSDDGFISDWAYTGGCRAPRENDGLLTEACTWTVAGVASESIRVWRIQQREIPPARGYYLEGEAPVYAPIAGTAVFHQGLCDGDAVQPRVLETQASNVERQTGLQCSGSFPDGTWDRQRSYTDTTGSVANARPPMEWTTRNYGNWVTTRNGCSNTTNRSERQTQVVNGCLDQYRDVTVTTVSYASGAAASVSSSNPAWINGANRCFTSNDRDSNRGYYDVDGDGKGDFPTEADARKYMRENGQSTVHIKKVDTCNFRCDGSSVDRASGDNRTSQTTGSTGDSAWQKVKNFFTGGNKSSGGGGGGSGGGSSCFVAGTLVTMADGSKKRIELIEPGDFVLDGGEVIMTGQFLPALMYNLGGVHVSGSHLVAYQDRWIPVEDHPDADFIGLADGPIYNIGTANNTMVCSGILFADHLEINPDLVAEALTYTAVEALAELNAPPRKALLKKLMTGFL